MNRDKFRRTANLEETPSKAMLAIDGAWSQSPRRNQRNWNNQKSQQLGSDFVMYNKACFVCGCFDHVQANLQGHPQREDHAMLVSGCLKAHGQGTTVYLSDFKNFESRICYLWEEPKEEHTGKGTLKLADESQVLLKVPRKNNMNASNDEPQPSSDVKKKDDEGDNATLKAIHADFFGREIEVDMRNITIAYPVPSTPNTRIHKDYSLDHVIGDVQSGVQTRRMTKTTNEQGFISAVYDRKTHEDLHTCLFACFLSQEEPKKVNQAIKL
ncbi:hypothetical protein Tco_1409413 [Tanacetum coccineum]